MPVAELYAELRQRVELWILGRVRNPAVAEDLAAAAWERCLAAERRGQVIGGGYV